MSEDSFSSMSDLDVMEGSVANPVHESQVDPSISQSIQHKSSASVLPVESTATKKEVAKLAPRRQKSLTQKLKELKSSSYQHRLSPQCQRSDPFDFLIDKQSVSKLPSFLRERLFKRSARGKVPDLTHFDEFQQKVNEKLEQIRQLKEEEELQTCTFKPNINRSAERKRTHTQQYNDMLKFQANREKKLQELKDAKSVEKSFKFQPSINDRSYQIMQEKPYLSEKCYNRLHDKYRWSILKEKTTTIDEEFSKYAEEPPAEFIPKVNRQSIEKSNIKPIYVRLHEDALRRRNIEHSFSSPQLATPSANSIRILVKGFLAEFNEQAKTLDIDDTGLLNYNRFVALFSKMHLLSSAKYNQEIVTILELWRMVGTDRAAIQDVKVLMMGIMGYFKPWMNSHKRQFALSEEDAKRMHDRYLHLFENRCAFGSNKSEKPPRKPTKEPKKLSFDDNTLKIEDSLLELGKMREQRLQELREKKIAESMNECTFKPELNKESVKLTSKSIDDTRTGSLSRQYRKLWATSNDIFVNLHKFAGIVKDAKHCFSQDQFSRSDGLVKVKMRKSIQLSLDIAKPRNSFSEASLPRTPHMRSFDPKSYADTISEKQSDASDKTANRASRSSHELSNKFDKLNTPDKSDLSGKSGSLNSFDVDKHSNPNSIADDRSNPDDSSDRESIIDGIHNNHEKFKSNLSSEKENYDEYEDFRNENNLITEHNIDLEAEINAGNYITSEISSNKTQKNDDEFSQNSDKSSEDLKIQDRNLTPSESPSEELKDMTEVEEVNESEEDESFIISVNIGKASTPVDLRIKTAQSAKSAVSLFSKKYKLRPKEESKLLNYVHQIISANT